MCESCAPSVKVSILFGRSGYGDFFGCVYDAASKNIHEVISLGRCFMCNNTAFCGGKMGLKMFVRDLSERWKSFRTESVMIPSVT